MHLGGRPDGGGWLRRLLPGMCVGLVLGPACRPDETRRPQRPNLVLVVVDALRRDHLNTYGYGPPTSPFLQRLGRESLVFDSAFAHASQTFNSTSILFTSRLFPLRGGSHGERYRQLSIARANLTLAEVLRDHGYETFGVFTNPHHYPGSGFLQGFDEATYLEPQSERKPYADATRVVNVLAAWLRDRCRDRPFFAYLHFMDVHNPYMPPPAFRKLFTPGKGRWLYQNGKPKGRFVPTEGDLEFMKARYDGEIRYVDSQLKRIVLDLDQHRLWEDTVLLVTSDHGDEFMEHGGLGHGVTLEKEMVWVPMILHPGRFGQGARRLDFLARHLDVAPTLLDLVGVAVPEVFEGRSLLPLLDGRPPSPEVHSLARQGLQRSLTTPRWHFVWNGETEQARLYDNRHDPHGLRDVAARHPDVTDGFRELLRSYDAREQAARRVSRELQAEKPAEPAPHPERLEQLRTLGYGE